MPVYFETVSPLAGTNHVLPGADFDTGRVYYTYTHHATSFSSENDKTISKRSVAPPW